MVKIFTEDGEVESEAVVRHAFIGFVQDTYHLLNAAIQDDNKVRVKLRKEQAAAMGVFGAPNFFVGNDMFWRDDRLEDAIHMMLSQTAAD